MKTQNLQNISRKEWEGLSELACRVAKTIKTRGLIGANAPMLLMVSGGSDSSALAYVMTELASAGLVGSVALLHVNHMLRGEEARGDARFVEELANLLEVPCEVYTCDVGTQARAEGGNVEAIGRRERYQAAHEALKRLCEHVGVATTEAHICTAHTRDDRVESFFMRSIVGTGPGGLRSIWFTHKEVVRPLLETDKAELRRYIEERAAQGLPVMRDETGALWREDITNTHVEHLRAFVRAQIVPQAKQRNPRLLETLCRTMDLIADEDDFMEDLATEAAHQHVRWESCAISDTHSAEACVLVPSFGSIALPLKRRVVYLVLQHLCGCDVRIEQAAIEAVCVAFDAQGCPISGYVVNISGNLAVSANRYGVRIEPMDAFRYRRKRRGASQQSKKSHVVCDKKLYCYPVRKPGAMSYKVHKFNEMSDARLSTYPDICSDVAVVLASASPRRHELLARAGVMFSVHVSHADETLDNELVLHPETAAEILADRKASLVAHQLAFHPNKLCTLVIGADTMVVCDGTVFGKPKNLDEAKDMLCALSGRTHTVVTGVSVWEIASVLMQNTSLAQVTPSKKHSFHDSSLVTFRNLSADEISTYLSYGESLDKAGAYAAQGAGAKLIKCIDGSLDTVLGLPVERLLQEFPALAGCS